MVLEKAIEQMRYKVKLREKILSTTKIIFHNSNFRCSSNVETDLKDFDVK